MKCMQLPSTSIVIADVVAVVQNRSAVWVNESRAPRPRLLIDVHAVKHGLVMPGRNASLSTADFHTSSA